MFQFLGFHAFVFRFGTVVAPKCFWIPSGLRNKAMNKNQWTTKIYWKSKSENTWMNNRNLLGPQLFPAVSTCVRFEACRHFFLCPNRRRKTMAELWDKGCQPRFNHHSWREMGSSHQFFSAWCLDLKFTAFKAGLACWSRLSKKKDIVGGSFFQHLWKKDALVKLGIIFWTVLGVTNQRNHLLVLLGKNNLWNHLLLC